MLTVTVKISCAEAIAAVRAIHASLSERTDLHVAVALAAEESVRAHLLSLDTRSPNTHYYAKASRSVESAADAGSAVVRVPHRGMAQRYHGGRILMKGRLLAIPTSSVPVRGDERIRPRQAGLLAFIPAKNGKGNVAGYLVQGEERRITRGKRKGQSRIVPRKAGAMMYALAEYVEQRGDEGVLPSTEMLSHAARDAALDYIFMQGGTV